MDRNDYARKMLAMQEAFNVSDKQLICMIASYANLDTLRDIILVMLMEDSNEQ